MKTKKLFILAGSICLILLLTALLLPACGGEGPTTPAPTEPAEPVTLKASHGLAKSDDWARVSMDNFVKRVEEKSDGRVLIDMYWSNSLVKYDQNREGVTMGIADLGWVVPGYYAGEFQMSQLFSLPPLWFTHYDGGRLVMETYDEYVYLDFEPMDMKVIGCWVQPAYGLFTKSKQVNTMEDVKGLKIRSNNPTTSGVIELMGGIPVVMSGSEVVDAMAKGMLDGAPSNAPLLRAMGIWDYGDPGYYVPNIGSIPGGMGTWAVDTKHYTYAKLPPDLQKIVDDEGNACMVGITKDLDRLYPEATATMVENGVIIVEWTDAEAKRLLDASQIFFDEWLADCEAKGFPGQALLDAVKARL